MSLTPRKRPEGLIDGCFGKSEYCPNCDYHVDDCICMTLSILQGLFNEISKPGRNAKKVFINKEDKDA